MHTYFAWLWGVLCLIYAAALGPMPAHAAGDPNRLVIGTPEFPDLLSYDFSLRVATQFALGPVIRPLVLPTTDFAMACELCMQIPSLANGQIKPDGPSGLSVVYTLKPDWFWGDGKPVTSRDLAFTIELARTPKLGFVRTGIYADITRVDTPDDRQLVIHFATTRYDVGALRITPTPEHLERPVLDRVGPEKYARETLYVTRPTEPGLWNGPYLVQEFVLRDHIVYGRNPYWKGIRPQFDQVVLRAIENVSALEQNLFSGDIDYGRNVSRMTAEALATTKDPRFDVTILPSIGRVVYQVNLENPYLAQLDFRRALIKAVDRRTIADKKVGNAFVPTNSFLSVRDPAYYQADGDSLDYDPDAARRLLDGLGYKLGSDGFRRDKSGLKISIELMIAAGDPAQSLLAALNQSYWKAIGIDVRIVPRQQAEVYRQGRERTYTGLLDESWIASPGDPPRLNFHSASIPTKANNFSGGNESGYANPEMDRLIDTARLEVDPARRQVLMNQIQAIYGRDLPELPFFTAAAPYVRPKYLTGVPLFPVDVATYRIEDWRIKR
jgi:peptide/nickel transport system substrate-binding protein